MSPSTRRLAVPSARALAAAALAALGALGGCMAPAPEPDDWLAFGFRGPEETVRSFLTALAGERPDLEYLCLSQGLKDRHGGNLLGYLELRDELRRRMPWLKAAARAEVEEVERLSRGRARVLARVDWLFWDEEFVVDLVAEGFYEYWSDAARLEDGYFAFAPTLRGGEVLLALPALEDTDFDEVTEIRGGLEWKIDSLMLPDPEP